LEKGNKDSISEKKYIYESANMVWFLIFALKLFREGRKKNSPVRTGLLHSLSR
jgi:hypothetical protein